MYCLYLITDGEHTKAGITNDTKHRLGMLQTGNPKPLSILLTCPMRNAEDARRLEKAVHDKYSAHRMMGEWFNPINKKKRAPMSWAAIREYVLERRAEVGLPPPGAAAAHSTEWRRPERRRTETSYL